MTRSIQHFAKEIESAAVIAAIERDGGVVLDTALASAEAGALRRDATRLLAPNAARPCPPSRMSTARGACRR